LVYPSELLIPFIMSGNKESYRKFNGSEDESTSKSFKVKDWEVWQLDFDV
jgi:hypothetical protein